MKRTKNSTALFALAAVSMMTVGTSAFAEPLIGQGPLSGRHQSAGETGASPLNEISGGTNSGLQFGSDTDTVFSLNGAYSRLLAMDMIQGTADFAFRTVSNDTRITLMVGPTLNIALDNEGLRNAVYVSGLIGFGLVDQADTSTEFSYKAAVGKRFELWTNIFWKPEFNLSGTTADNTNVLFSLVPAQFSFMF